MTSSLYRGDGGNGTRIVACGGYRVATKSAPKARELSMNALDSKDAVWITSVCILLFDKSGVFEKIAKELFDGTL